MHNVECMARGFSLIEVVVALGVLCTATVALAQLPLLAARTNEIARQITIAETMATAKMEEVRAVDWDALAVSKAGSLAHNAPGCFDFLDDSGLSVGTGPSPPPTASFVRRWSVDLSEPEGLKVVQVAVTPIAADALQLGRRARSMEVRIVGVTSRRPR